MSDDELTPMYTASDLAARVGVSERTVRYYVTEGLLPPPAGRGRGAHFGAGHLARLKLVRAMQQAGNGLETIREYLAELGSGDDKVEAALRLWESRREQVEWAETWREKFGSPSTGSPSTLHRYRIAEGVELLVDAKTAPTRARMTTILRQVRQAFAEEE